MPKGIYKRTPEMLKKVGFQKGKHISSSTEFKKGHNLTKGEKNVNWKGGVSKDKEYRRKQVRDWHRKKTEKKATRAKPNRCEICGKLSSDLNVGLHFDHDHNTGEFRGWLCRRCNIVLGFVEDNVEILENLIKYLKKFYGFK